MKNKKKIGILLLTAMLIFSNAGCGMADGKSGRSDTAHTSEVDSSVTEGGNSGAGNADLTDENGGDGNGSFADESDRAGIGELKEKNDGAGKSGKEPEQTITVKAGPEGEIRSASVRTSEDDLEEEDDLDHDDDPDPDAEADAEPDTEEGGADTEEK